MNRNLLFTGQIRQIIQFARVTRATTGAEAPFECPGVILSFLRFHPDPRRFQKGFFRPAFALIYQRRKPRRGLAVSVRQDFLARKMWMSIRGLFCWWLRENWPRWKGNDTFCSAHAKRKERDTGECAKALHHFAPTGVCWARDRRFGWLLGILNRNGRMEWTSFRNTSFML